MAKFKVWSPEFECEEDHLLIEAACARYAAHDGAKDFDEHCGSPVVHSPKAVEFHVRDEKGRLSRWFVTGEMEPAYHVASAVGAEKLARVLRLEEEEQ